ncbi:MAG: hypothetical protein DRJ38_05340 [Thermoprotei archaeon]|nr:MAG: hypothetical protein DRJ38_05340 [Thermoprotei archaeon]
MVSILKLVVVKLGGSAITDKNKRYTPRYDVIENIAYDVKKLSEKFQLILIHGGGSFGHPVAKEYEIHKGFFSKKQILGYSKVRYYMTMLNQIVLEKMIEAGVPAVTLHTSNIAIAKNGEIFSMDADKILKYLNLGMVPILYGDAILDLNKGFCIISGDQIASYLALKLRPWKVVLGTDVDGIYSKDPKKHPQAKLIQVFSISEIEKIRTEKLEIDVTGGILAKILEMEKVVETGIPVIIGNITIKNGLLKLVKEETPKYTKIIV